MKFNIDWRGLQANLLICAIGAGIFVVAGLSKHARAQTEQPQIIYVARAEIRDEGVYIYRDRTYGCEYVIAVHGLHGIAITPRMRERHRIDYPDRQVCRSR